MSAAYVNDDDNLLWLASKPTTFYYIDSFFFVHTAGAARHGMVGQPKHFLHALLIYTE